MSPVNKNRISSQEASALAERYLDLYGNAMFRFAYSFMKNREDAEDVVQDALIRAISSGTVFENEAHEKTYLFQIIKNRCLDLIKKRDRHPVRSFEETMGAEEIGTEEKSNLSYVLEAVGKLPTNERTAVHLFYAEGLSTAEIAKVTGRKESTVRSDLLRGRKRLKAILKEEYDFE